ncbi:RagB/SusD family nutrient uptake outer membrane protein [Pseudobacter ginsenosidimutans]|uniref:SusD-like starch-binding protein associating with outer membrane n=1 Tax=Pseudobacter ginsenosidimutans TaxID=661488 RepID=A0A4Q7MP55_9BACT|nr:RagB/SusD family nutrient uptake outer membrane protein [Pseudobacter ginsenosidimutans]QEC45677.1 RagB/SusD family nutrient uptake outer membrane protein [Pseudobacter ginsenosidimutans]RZS69388.1 SusD-like starch-binding protein associating with outer membrane [Pseudobacter ginsenosidimutans]
MKLKNIMVPVGLLLAGFLFTGCKKFLEELPRGVIIAKTTSDFRKLMDDVDNQRYQFSLSQVSSHVDVVSDDVYADSSRWLSWTTTRQHVNALYAFEQQVWLYEAMTDDVNWKNQYYIVSLIGTILIEMEKVKDNETVKKQLMAEARVHRAYAYLNLVNIYAKHYNPQTAATDPGVPIIDDASLLPALPRASVQKIYDLVIAELKLALPDLPDNYAQYSHRPCKAAVHAILARTYLYMGKYEDALLEADKALAIRSFLHDFNTLYNGAPVVANLIGMSRTEDQEVILHKTTSKNFRLNTYMILDTASFNKLYPDFENTGSGINNHDLRRTLRFTGFNALGEQTGKEVTYNVTFNNWYKKDGANSSGADNIHIGTPEMYLIRAECYARTGQLQKALDDVNLICNKRYKTGTYQLKLAADFNNDQQAVVNEVLLQRRRELYGKELRLFDIKRLGLPVTHYISSRQVSVPAGDPKLVWPIFNKYIEMNPEIEQNPR